MREMDPADGGADLPLYPLPLGRRFRGEWFPLRYDALLGSRFAATVDPAAGFFAVMLWCEAARQDPAGTLPTDERELAALAGLGRDLASWREVASSGALYGWTECRCEGEGEREGEARVRLMHPRLTEVMQDAIRRLDARAEESRRGGERSRRSFLIRQMLAGGAHGGLTQREEFVEAVMAELSAHSVKWTVSNVRVAVERVSLMLDGPDETGRVVAAMTRPTGGGRASH